MKIIGIDVGGTNADGVVLENGNIATKAKLSVDQENLSDLIITLLEMLQKGSDVKDLSQLHLSTTLCTNALVGNRLDPVGMLIQAGPGMNPEFLDCGDYKIFLDGAIDHRGRVIKKPSPEKVASALADFRNKGIESIGIVTKFSHRNPEIEQELADSARAFPRISTGNVISGLPNFPRRVYTTWLNAGLKNRFFEFEKAIQKGVKQLAIKAPIHVLKADGGTIPLEQASLLPCESIYSGPSASVMGALALTPRSSDFIVLDIGGTTTDIGLFAGGEPLMEPYGITVMGRPTLIRALNTRSAGLGGDSSVSYENGDFTIGPDRAISAALSTAVVTEATPTDAMVVLGKIPGNREKATEAMLLLKSSPPEETAKALLQSFTQKIKEAACLMIEEIFARPVYTVSAFLDRKKLTPSEIVVVGGPAAALKEQIEAAFALPCTVPENYEVANAIGAARTRPTLAATLYANSSDGILTIPEIGLHKKIGRSFDMADAENELKDAIRQLAANAGLKETAEIDFVEKEEMNTVRGFSATGKVITLKAQITPGLTTF